MLQVQSRECLHQHTGTKCLFLSFLVPLSHHGGKCSLEGSLDVFPIYSPSPVAGGSTCTVTVALPH